MADHRLVAEGEKKNWKQFRRGVSGTVGHLLVFDSRRPLTPSRARNGMCFGGSWLRDTQAHCKGAGLFPFPPPPWPDPLPSLATSEEHITACYTEGPAAAGLASPGPIVHLRANDVEKQQVQGHSRAGLSRAVLCKLTPTRAPGPFVGGVCADSSLSLCPRHFASQVPTLVNFPQIIPETHTRYAPAPPAAWTDHIPRSSTNTLFGSKTASAVAVSRDSELPH